MFNDAAMLPCEEDAASLDGREPVTVPPRKISSSSGSFIAKVDVEERVINVTIAKLFRNLEKLGKTILINTP
jgi:hypothetical protein